MEFDENGTTRQAIIHWDNHYGELGSIDDNGSRSYFWRAASTLKNTRKVGTVDLPKTVCNSGSARKFAKSYFIKPS